MSFKIDKNLGDSIRKDLTAYLEETYGAEGYRDGNAYRWELGGGEGTISLFVDHGDGVSLDFKSNKDGETQNLFDMEVTRYADELDDFKVFNHLPEAGFFEEYSVLWDMNEETFSRNQIENFKDHESISNKIIDSINIE